ncbi:MAG: hypothetical protein LBF77_11005 [Spirochaetaceae bacterium]|jgi:hypothetical protein|nr:hypothetical protein [Spirochaetaceae bacterium]
MSRFIFTLLAALFFSDVVFAQAAPGGVSPQPASPAAQAGEAVPPADPARPFPLVPILETISAGEIFWRPDWPVEMPPDLFAVSGEVRSVTVTLEFPAADMTGLAGTGSSDSVNTADASNPADSSNLSGSPEPVTRFEYTLSRDEGGRLTDFPFFMNGGFSQTGVSYEEWGRIAGLTVSVQVLWRIEFIEYDDGTGLPVLARLNAGSPAAGAANAGTGAPDATGGADSGGVWFIAALEYRGLSASETWYDPAGTGLAVYNYRYDGRDGKRRLLGSVDFLAGENRTEEYHYDSWGNLTAVGGACSAVYRENRPQYWRRPFPPSPVAEDAAAEDAAALENIAAAGGDVSGDAAGDVSPGEIPWRFIFQWDERGLVTSLLGYPEDESAGDGWDIRYDYTLDGGGNWKERREIRMIRLGDYLFPRTGVFVGRQIDYREQ